MEIVFGPVPSRRLGRSLGVNNVFPKFCTYSCIYCQIGITTDLTIDRRAFYSVAEVFRAVEDRVRKLEAAGERIDYITFVPDGEPTLDINLGKEVEMIKSLGYPIAILTNGSLLYREDVRNDLSLFDYVCIKIDASTELTWKRINRPHPSLSLEKVFEGMEEFSKSFRGILATETMLVKNVNDSIEELKEVAQIIKEINPRIAYIAIPTRPPALEWVEPPDEEAVFRAYKVFRGTLPRDTEVELLVSSEGIDFTALGDPKEALLAILSVHPMRLKAIEEFLKKLNSDLSILHELIERGEVVEVKYRGEVFYLKKFSRDNKGET
ncbi:MAG TPA: radical SAM protein, partial [Ignisphaera sp.]|nr:radical SAM protein [Ignisphaera sp.]